MTFLSASQRVPIIGGGAGGLDRFLSTVRGVPRWRDRFPQYGIKVSYWGSGTLKIVIPVSKITERSADDLTNLTPFSVFGQTFGMFSPPPPPPAPPAGKTLFRERRFGVSSIPKMALQGAHRAYFYSKTH